MKLPPLDEPNKYRGLYVYDAGEWTSVGYTAEEIAILLESEEHRGGKVYRIHRASPDGQMELQGVSADQFAKESGMFFLRDDPKAAKDDFAALCDAAQTDPPPCRARLQLVQRTAAARNGSYLTALIYPAEYEADVGDWLSAIRFVGGDTVEGGPSHVSDFYEQGKKILERHQLWSAKSRTSRSAEEVLANVRRAVQR